MRFENSLLYPVEELIYDETTEDYRICRIPEEVRKRLNQKAQTNMMFTSSSELRFVMKGDTVEIVLRRMPVQGLIRSAGILEVYQGDYQGSYEISPGVITVEDTVVTIHKQDLRYISQFPSEISAFAPQVTRVLLPYDWAVVSRRSGER